MRKTKIVVRVMIIIVCVLLQMSFVSAASYKVSVKKYAQEKSNWCWAACSQMMGNYYLKNYSQSTICKHVKGKVVNKGASLKEVTKALQYSTKKPVVQGGRIAFKGIRKALKNKKPLVLRMQWNVGGGHVYVVSGARDASGPQLKGLYLINPVKGHANAWAGYASLVNGVSLASGTGYYSHSWTIN